VERSATEAINAGHDVDFHIEYRPDGSIDVDFRSRAN
jgi:hypothetical protein